MNEVLRQGIHLLFGLFLAALLLVYGRESLLVFLSLALAFAIIASYLKKNGFSHFHLDKILHLAQRRKETNTPLVGPMFYLLGVLATTIFFTDTKIILGGILVLAAGDAFSTLIGKKLGKTLLTKRHTLEGTIGGTLAAFAALFLVFAPLTAFLAALAGMLSELLSLEDNFTIPLASAAALTLLL